MSICHARLGTERAMAASKCVLRGIGGTQAQSNAAQLLKCQTNPTIYELPMSL